MKTNLLNDFYTKIGNTKNLDQSSFDYLMDEYTKLTDLENITIQVSDFAGNKTKYHSLSLESLYFLTLLLEKQLKEKGDL